MKLSLTLLFLQLWGNVELSLSQNACSKLPDVPHAHVSEETKKAEYQEGDVIHFTCESGYISDHTSKYVCTGAGWLAVRQGKCYSCSKLPDVPHANVTDETRKAEYQEGDVIHFTCESGYTSDFTIKYVCASEGWLAVRQGLCYYPCQVSKMHPRLFVAGLPPPNEIIKAGHKLQFQCSNDLILHGSEETECLETGQWSAPFPTCSVTPCPRPDETRNGRYRIIEGEDFVFGTAIQYICNQGYRMVGNDTLKCLQHGWTGKAPTCKLITCEVGVLHPDLIVLGMLSGSETVEVGFKLLFDCGGELQLDGSKEIECLPPGQWSAPIPTCTEKCEVSGLPDNVVVTPRISGRHLIKGQTLTFSCSQRGQIIQGNAKVECLASGQWSHSFPTCGAPAGCGKPPALADGETKITVQHAYSHNDKVEYVCQSLYLMEGELFKTCKNGEWIGQMRCLKPCTVDRDVMRRRNIRFAHTYEAKLYVVHDDTIEFSCIYGRRPVGTVEMRQKCIDGVMNFPTCM